MTRIETYARGAAGVLLMAGTAACLPVIPEMRGPTDPTYRENPQADAAEAAALINARRAEIGCPPLQWLEGAARAAQAHSDDMAARNYFGHRSPEGQTLADRLQAQGVRHHGGAENLARVPGGPRDAYRTWLASAQHRANLQNCAYTQHGLGVRDGRWTHVLLTPPPPQ
jgi:uncharacterized protein YkwD